MRNITLYIPGLLGFYRNDLYSDFSTPDTLTSVLNHSKKTSQAEIPYCERLAGLFGLQLGDKQGFPAATVTRLIDDAERPQGFWMRADPVHLSADARGMTLYDVTRLLLEQHEVLALGAKLQAMFEQRGINLEIPTADRWYVKLPHEPMIETQDIHQVRGQSILNRMPQGRDRDLWLQIINEIQMLLHDCDINQIREAGGKLPVNSLWFWGAGPLPDILPRNWSTVYSDDALVRGLCMLSGTNCKPVDSFINTIADDDDRGEDLVVLNSAQICRDYQDVPAWHDCVTRLDKEWLVPITSRIRLNSIHSLSLITDAWNFTFRKRDLLKFWKGFGKFGDYLNT